MKRVTDFVRQVLNEHQKEDIVKGKRVDTDPIVAIEWLLNTEKVFRISKVSKEDKYETQFNMKAHFASRFVTSEQPKIEHFVDGLRREIKEFVSNRDLTSFRRAVECARRREHELSFYGESTPEPKRQRTKITTFVPSNTPRACQRCGKAHSGRCFFEPSKMSCYSCGEVGHIRTNCPRRDRACYTCGAYIHHQLKCPNAQREDSKASVRQPMVGGSSTRKEEVPKARVRAFQITAEEAREEPELVTSIFFVNSHPARILFDSGSTYSFMSHAFVRFLESVPVLFDRPFSVDTASGTPLLADRVFKDCTLVLEDQNFSVDLIFISKSGGYYLRATDDPNTVSEEDYVYVYGEKGVGDIKVISVLKARRYLSKECTSFMAYVLDATKERNKLAKDVPVVCEFQDAFPDDLPGLPPDRQVEFRIDLVPGAAPIATDTLSSCPGRNERNDEPITGIIG
ncbi:uncharacterized protein LOC112502334 [Cynara cardunculus var. scolymus]|uniref:uncharacterized protein LOC112502334 n=1 Tax=Cynara cardunculus var. scolymus TaxID=59895 RepID=UPI000D628618|nr:uncharacterized protein LOC112502334 [Cynara cardunculus var. scolymus]